MGERDKSQESYSSRLFQQVADKLEAIRRPGSESTRLTSLLLDSERKAYLPISGVAKLAGISPERIGDLISENKLKTFKLTGHDIYIEVDSVVTYVTEGGKTSEPPRLRIGWKS